MLKWLDFDSQPDADCFKMLYLVREILAEIDPSELLMLDLEEQEERFGNAAEDKKQKKLREALDKDKSKKKFAGLVKTGGESSKKGISFKQYQANLKATEAKKKEAEEKRKKAEETLKSSFAAYGSSSSDEDDETAEPNPAPKSPSPQSPVEQEFKVPEPVVSEKPPPVDQLPPGFIDEPEVSKETDKPKDETKKRPAEIGSADFWSSVIKKKR